MSLLFARNRVLIYILGLISIVASIAGQPAGAQTTASLPVLARAAAVAPPTMTIAVTGHSFTPGGLVYVAVYDRWGVDLYGHVWTVATTGSFGEHGSQDPARGYIPAGAVYEVIDLLPETVYGENGSQDPALGYARGIDADTALDAVYGPYGSQDPALGYVPAADQATAGASCGRDLMIRAYDQQAAAWSNLLDVTAGC